MGEVLEGAGEGQVVWLRLGGQDVVLPRLLCWRQTGEEREGGGEEQEVRDTSGRGHRGRSQTEGRWYLDVAGGKFSKLTAD